MTGAAVQRMATADNTVSAGAESVLAATGFAAEALHDRVDAGVQSRPLQQDATQQRMIPRQVTFPKNTELQLSTVSTVSTRLRHSATTGRSTAALPASQAAVLARSATVGSTSRSLDPRFWNSSSPSNAQSWSHPQAKPQRPASANQSSIRGAPGPAVLADPLSPQLPESALSSIAMEMEWPPERVPRCASPMLSNQKQHRTTSSAKLLQTRGWLHELVGGNEEMQPQQGLPGPPRVLHSGWIFKAVGRPPHRKWVRKWAYLLNDRFCWTAPADGSAPVALTAGSALNSPESTWSTAASSSAPGSTIKYISLDRIPVRPVPRGYTPRIGVTLVEDRQLHPGDLLQVKSGVVFSIVCGSHTHFWATDTVKQAEEWVRMLRDAWMYSTKHTARSGKLKGEAADAPVHQFARLLASNAELRETVDVLDQKVRTTDSHYYRAWLKEREENLAHQVANKVIYEVQVKTGRQRGAGTDCRVYLQMHGHAQDPNGQQLKSGKELLQHIHTLRRPFSRDSLDDFEMVAPELGLVRRLTVQHDSSGHNPDWFLESVQVRRKGGNGKWTLFPCHRWLSHRLDDRRTTRDLYPGTALKQTEFKVLVKTSKCQGAGTDANVYIVMHGDKGDSARHALTSGRDDFERGQENEFTLEDSNIGRIFAVTIGHDNAGKGPDWHVESVEVVKPAFNQRYFFHANCWISAREGLERRLESGAQALQPRKYSLVIETTDLRGAGTDADVFVTLHGVGRDGFVRDSPTFKLPSRPEHFERGQRDDFDVIAPDLGRLEKLTIGHNSLGEGPAWHLTQVEVTEEDGNKTFFACNNWLMEPDAEQPHATTKATLLAEKEDPKTRISTYDLIIETGAGRGAGTDARVFFQLFGKAGAAPMKELSAPLEAFERGRTDSFTIPNMPFLGPLSKLVLEHDNQAANSDWQVVRVSVYCHKDKSTTVFEANRWVSAPQGQRAHLEILTGDAAAAACVYTVTVKTSNVKGAGTDANVSLVINAVDDKGKKLRIGPARLDNAADNFERNRQDTFHIQDLVAAEISSIEVSHDGTSSKPEWHLEWVQITSDKHGDRSWTFYHREWIRSAEPGQRAAVLLEPLDHDPLGPLLTAHVQVHTANEKGAGTDSEIFLDVVGDRLSTGFCHLATSYDYDPFERGSVDEFELQVRDVGKMKHITVQSDGQGGAKADWRLDYIKIKLEGKDGRPAQTAYFIGPALLSPSSQLELELQACPEDCFTTYRSTFTTSDLPNSETNGQVRMTLVGLDNGSDGNKVPRIGPCLVDNPAEVFAPQAPVEFPLRCRTISPLKEITLQLSRVGIPDGVCQEAYEDRRTGLPVEAKPWHLDTVSIKDELSGQLYYFDASQWLTPGVPVTLSASMTDPQYTKKEYRISVRTGTDRRAGTDANVWIDIHGEYTGVKHSTGRLELRRRSILQNLFERGQTDDFTFKLSSLGKLTHIVLGHDNTGLGADWLVDQVKITVEGATTWFYNHEKAWLKAQDSQGEVRLQLEACSEDPTQAIGRYEVTVKTGDERGAGTDSNVFLVIHGTTAGGAAADTGKLVLDDPRRNDFERGQTDRFEVEAKSLDNITHIRLGHDNKSFIPGVGDAWLVEWVKIRNLKTSQEAVFPCGQWFSTQKGDKQIERDLYPGDGRDHNATYSFRITTADERGAGTDADVFVEVEGTAGTKAGPIRLDDPKRNDFERGQTDSFEIKAVDVGEVSALTMWHNAKGLFADWKPYMVELSSSSNPGKVYYFYYNCWLKGEQDKRRVAATLEHPEKSMVTYKVRVKTSDVRYAGTDARVFMVLHGEGGVESPSTELKKKGLVNLFERNQCDDFEVPLQPLGKLEALTISHDGSGIGAGWHLEHVEVDDPATGLTYHFPCNRWLDKGKEDRQTLRKLVAAEPVQKCSYRISTHTSDIRGAGTDASVYVILYGEHGDTGKLELRNHTTPYTDLFERNQVDTFEETAADVGVLSKLRVGHDNKGWGPDWHCSRVEVENLTTGQQAVFMVDAWLAKKKGDGMLERECMPTSRGVTGPSIPWEVTVVTGKDRGAGTDADVYVELRGQLAKHRAQLRAGPEAFERGQQDTFSIHTPDVGPLQSIEVGHNGKGWGDAWQLDSLQLRNLATNETYNFSANKWLDNKHGTSTVLHAGASGALLCSYRVIVKTASQRGAGTDANVALLVRGTEGEFGPEALGKAASVKKGIMLNLFERGSSDEFELRSKPDVGEFTEVEVSHDGNGFMQNSDWLLESVTIENTTSGRQATFPCNRWLNKKQEDGMVNRRVLTLGGRPAGQAGPTLKRSARAQLPRSVEEQEARTWGEHMNMETEALPTLVASNATFASVPAPTQAPRQSPALPNSGYVITFRTSNQCRAGTTSQVQFKLVGSSCTTEWVMMPDRPGAFSRGCEVQATFKDLPYVGDLRAVQVMNNGFGMFANWHLRQILVLHLASGSQWQCNCHEWVLRGQSRTFSTEAVAF